MKDSLTSNVSLSAAEEKYYLASSWTLMLRRFVKHKLAVVGAVILALFYILAIFANFFSVSEPYERHKKYTLAPPTPIHFFHEGKLHRPFVYGLKSGRHPTTRAKVFVTDFEKVYPIRFFVKGYEYRVLGLFPSRLHFMGVDKPGVLYYLAPKA